MGRYYTIPNHNAKFTNSFKEKPANELQDAVRFFSIQDCQDLLDSYQARAVYVFSPVIRDIINRELERRKHFTEAKDKVLVVPVSNVSLSILEKIVQLTHSGFTDISKQSFSSMEFEDALIRLQIDFLTDENTKSRASHTGTLVREHVNHGQQPMIAAMSMISADDYYPPNYNFAVMHQLQSSSKSGTGKGRGRKAAVPVVDDSDSNSSDFVPKKKRVRTTTPYCKPSDKTIWRCGFDCPGLFFYSLKEQTAHHADVHKVDFGEGKSRKSR